MLFSDIKNNSLALNATACSDGYLTSKSWH